MGVDNLSVLDEVFGAFSFLDNFFLYLGLLSLSLFLFMQFVKAVYDHFSNPHEYYSLGFEKKLILGFLFFICLFAYCFYNIVRFF